MKAGVVVPEREDLNVKELLKIENASPEHNYGSEEEEDDDDNWDDFAEGLHEKRHDEDEGGYGGDAPIPSEKRWI